MVHAHFVPAPAWIRRMPHGRRAMARPSALAAAGLQCSNHCYISYRRPHTSSRSRCGCFPLHMAGAHVVGKDVRCACQCLKSIGKILSDRECTPVNAFWPPILWSPLFRADPASSFIDEARNLRSEWLEHFRNRDGFEPRTIFLCASRWANEKRILEIFPCIPEDCGLVIVGDGTSMYSDQVATSSAEPIERDPDTGKIVRRPPPQHGILALRKMLNATDLRIAYQACDVFVSASAFETLGNTIIESLCSGTLLLCSPHRVT